MSNISKFEFVTLNISGKNYLSWTLDAEIHLEVMNLGNTIKAVNNVSLQDRIKAMIFLCHHFNEVLKSEYQTVNDSFVHWQSLKEKYDHLRDIIIPQARYK